MSEERRLNASIIGGVQFMLFPIFILILSLVLSLAAPQLLKNIRLDEAYLILHVVVLVYGFSVGGLASFGDRIAERRFGPVSFVLQTPATQPIAYRELFSAFYVKEIIYYFLYSIVPIIGGMLLSIPVSGFRVNSVLFLLLTLTLSFLLGLSFSFFLSAISARSKSVLIAILGILALAFILSLLIGFDPANLVPSIALQRTGDPVHLLAALAMFVFFSVIALSMLRIKSPSRSERYEAEMLEMASRFSFLRWNATLAGKDWIDLVRSRTLIPVLSAYVGPLIVLALLFWFLKTVAAIELDLNAIFYGSMIGFFSVSIYSWLNILDNNGFMDLLPLSVAQVIRTKLLMLSLIAVFICTAFLVILSWLSGKLDILPLGLVVAYVTTAYTVTVTAYLTGLRTNSYLFDPRVLMKFCGLCIPPLCALVILSLGYSTDTVFMAILILAICGVMLLATLAMYKRIGKRWGKATFSL